MSVWSAADDQVARLYALAAILIPGSPAMPAATEVTSLEDMLRVALKACGYATEDVGAAIDAVPHEADWEAVKSFAAQHPQQFHIVSTLVSAAYLMAPQVLESLKFAINRQHPAEVEEFVEEYETGILEPVTDRGSRFRVPNEGLTD